MDIIKQLAAPMNSLLKIFSGEKAKELNPIEEQNIFGFYSPSGGTGVTTCVANVATILAASGTVALLDLDIFYPSLFRFFMTEEDDKTSLAADIFDKFITVGKDITTFGHKTIVDNVVLFSCLRETDIVKYCEVDYANICKTIRELSKLYDYV